MRDLVEAEFAQLIEEKDRLERLIVRSRDDILAHLEELRQAITASIPAVATSVSAGAAAVASNNTPQASPKLRESARGPVRSLSMNNISNTSSLPASGQVGSRSQPTTPKGDRIAVLPEKVRLRSLSETLGDSRDTINHQGTEARGGPSGSPSLLRLGESFLKNLSSNNPGLMRLFSKEKEILSSLSSRRTSSGSHINRPESPPRGAASAAGRSVSPSLASTSRGGGGGGGGSSIIGRSSQDASIASSSAPPDVVAAAAAAAVAQELREGERPLTEREARRAARRERRNAKKAVASASSSAYSSGDERERDIIRQSLDAHPPPLRLVPEHERAPEPPESDLRSGRSERKKNKKKHRSKKDKEKKEEKKRRHSAGDQAEVSAIGPVGGGLADPARPDLSRLVAPRSFFERNKYSVGKSRVVVKDTSHWIRCVACTERYILYGCLNKSEICVYDLEAQAFLRSLRGHTGVVYCLQLAAAAAGPAGRVLLSGSGDGTVRSWDLDRMEALPQRTLDAHPGHGVLCLQVSAQYLVTGGSDNLVRLWELSSATGEARALRTLEGHTSSVWCVAHSADLGRLVSGSDDHTILIWDLATGNLLRTIRARTSFLCLALQHYVIISGSEDGNVEVWDLESGQLLKVLLQAHQGPVECLQVRDDILVTGSYDKTLKIWDLNSGHCHQTLKGHTLGVYCLHYDPTRVVSGSEDGHLRIWPLKEKKA
jgi:WD40 repeat protein